VDEMPKFDTGSISGLKDFYQWYIYEVNNIKNPHSNVIKYRDTYKKFLKFWEESCSSEEKRRILNDMIGFYVNCIEEYEDFIVRYGDFDYDVRDMMKLDKDTLEMLKAIK